MVAFLADGLFPECHATPRNAGETCCSISEWLTQAHVDYIVRAQELYDGDDHCELIGKSAMAVLGHALTVGLQWTTCTRFANGVQFTHGRVDVVERKDLAVDKEHVEQAQTSSNSSYNPQSRVLHLFLEPLIIERQRLTVCTVLRAMPMMIPRQLLSITPDVRIVVEGLPSMEDLMPSMPHGEEDSNLHGNTSDATSHPHPPTPLHM